MVDPGCHHRCRHTVRAADAGRRTVAISTVILPDLAAHLAEFVAADIDAFVFLGENGGQLRRSNFRRATHWTTTVTSVGLDAEFHFHDLRHTGNQLAAEAGATTRELMRRMGATARSGRPCATSTRPTGGTVRSLPK
jgi:integrase